MNYKEWAESKAGAKPAMETIEAPGTDDPLATTIRTHILAQRTGIEVHESWVNSTPVACGHYEKVGGCSECEP